jgi:hypothetical protein
MAFTDSADVVGPQGADAAPDQGPPSGPPAGGQPPQGGGPVLAAIARRQRGPQISAAGPGDQAQSMQLLMQAVGLIQQALPGLPPGSPMHKDALNAAQRLSRHANQGAPTAGVQATQLQDLLRNVMRNALLQRIMGQQGNQGPQQMGAGPSPMGEASAAPPMPSTPLPGA